jgi:multisubunit Na+/H+ antiporter MnhE subunit
MPDFSKGMRLPETYIVLAFALIFFWSVIDSSTDYYDAYLAVALPFLVGYILLNAKSHDFDKEKKLVFAFRIVFFFVPRI